MISFKKLKTLGRVLTLFFALLLAFLIAATYSASVYSEFLNDRLQIQESQVVVNENAEPIYFYQSDYQSQDELYEAKLALNREIAGEGAVLLKNTDNALPLDASEESNISVFGRSSVDVIKGIEGGGSLIPDANDPLTEVFSSFGVTINPTLYNFYANSGYSYEYAGSITIGEVPVREYTDAVRQSYNDYSDAAIVMLSRSKSEGSDFSLNPADVSDGDGVHHGLAIQNNERDMINEAKSCSDKVIVLINSDYAMEIHELKEDPEIDAILWIGGAGLNGIYGSVDVLMGEKSPSGGLADTYAANLASSPAAQGWGGAAYTNHSEDLQTYYTVYQEGIYVGYKYYETRYEDTVLNRYNASSTAGAYNSEQGWNYSDEVSYPFGYGLSYTTFEEVVHQPEFDGTTATIEVDVTNTGDVDGKHIVQIYAQSPYTDYDRQNNVEKAAVQLVGFAKTGVLEANGGHETVTVEINMYNLASYDYTSAKTYILEAGTYYFATGNGSHDALNNILAAKGYDTSDGMDYNGNEDLAVSFVQEENDFETYSVAWQTGEPITNQLDNVDINYYGNFVTYLSRSDWEGTWPEADLQIAATDQMIAEMQNGATYTPTVATEEDRANMIYDSDETAYPILMLRDEPFNSPYWEDILNQLSLDEMSRLVGASGNGLIVCNSIVFDGTSNRDGPAGIKANYTEGKYTGKSAVMFPSEPVIASTFNVELARRVGEVMGNDALWFDTTLVHAPGINIHRTPMSGRNAEYFSEDSVLSSEMGYAEIAGGLEYGFIMGAKHFALNDQESHRNGIATYANEQGAREIMLRAFEKPLSIGLSMMSAYNRVGCIYSSAHVGLMSGILRGEWGFKGQACSDAVGSRALSRYADGPASVTAGLSLYCVTVESLYCGPNGSLNPEAITSDPVLFQAMRDACHYNLYMAVHSSAVNGYSDDMNVIEITPWYWTAVVAADCVVAVLLAASIACYAVFAVKNSRKEG